MIKITPDKIQTNTYNKHMLPLQLSNTQYQTKRLKERKGWKVQMTKESFTPGTVGNFQLHKNDKYTNTKRKTQKINEVEKLYLLRCSNILAECAFTPFSLYLVWINWQIKKFL